MSADWPSFLTWLAERGPDDPVEAWERFSALAASSAREDALALVTRYASHLPDLPRTSVAAGVALLMREIEWPPHLDAPRQQVISALGDLLAELDIARPATIGSALCREPAERGTLVAWARVLHLARMMLIQAEHPGHTSSIAELCNVGLHNVLQCLRESRRRESDAQYLQNTEVQSAWVAFLHALTRYTDAARQLNDALGAALFADLTALMPASLKDL